MSLLEHSFESRFDDRRPDSLHLRSRHPLYDALREGCNCMWKRTTFCFNFLDTNSGSLQRSSEYSPRNKYRTCSILDGTFDMRSYKSILYGGELVNKEQEAAMVAGAVIETEFGKPLLEKTQKMEEQIITLIEEGNQNTLVLRELKSWNTISVHQV
ncbi:hypothetical protein PROFUN_01209 [Planoprotostelium fungivorum]|uniref:Uncharacterized protein n=1 Tax=Planoprotostelium fungivorum TaxID=1890364 RepID=A0A2P6NCP1_9EUKA|nr:hypothetical protein PROFUN_01209 [Planoprotostelium fungivorum]